MSWGSGPSHTDFLGVEPRKGAPSTRSLRCMSFALWWRPEPHFAAELGAPGRSPPPTAPPWPPPSPPRPPADSLTSWTFCPWSRPLGGGLPSSTAVRIVGAWSPLALVQSFVHSTAPRNASLEPSGQHTLTRPLQTGPPHLPKPASVLWGPWGAACLPCLLCLLCLLLSLALHVLGLSGSKCSLCPPALGPPQLRSLPCFSG